MALAWLMLALAPAHTVAIQEFRYTPSPLISRSGESVAWRNPDWAPPAVTSSAGQFDPAEIPPNASCTFRPLKKGRFPDVCQHHPGTAGTLAVRSGAEKARLRRVRQETPGQERSGRPV